MSTCSVIENGIGFQHFLHLVFPDYDFFFELFECQTNPLSPSFGVVEPRVVTTPFVVLVELVRRARRVYRPKGRPLAGFRGLGANVFPTIAEHERSGKPFGAPHHDRSSATYRIWTANANDARGQSVGRQTNAAKINKSSRYGSRGPNREATVSRFVNVQYLLMSIRRLSIDNKIFIIYAFITRTATDSIITHVTAVAQSGVSVITLLQLSSSLVGNRVICG